MENEIVFSPKGVSSTAAEMFILMGTECKDIVLPPMPASDTPGNDPGIQGSYPSRSIRVYSRIFLVFDIPHSYQSFDTDFCIKTMPLPLYNL